MAAAGNEAVAAAKANGAWEKQDRPRKTIEVPPALKKALSMNKKANAYFRGLPPSHRARYAAWVANAKKDETKERRIRESIRMLENKVEFGLK